MESCINNLVSNNDTVHNLVKEDLKEHPKFASYELLFTFHNKYYFQLDGYIMGSTL